MADLLFRLPPAATADLLLGEVESLPDATALVNGRLPGFAGQILLGRRVPATLAGQLPRFGGAVATRIDENVDRPLTAGTRMAHESAAPAHGRARERFERAQATHATAGADWSAAGPLRASARPSHRETSRDVRGSTRARHQTAARLPPNAWSARHQDGLRDRRLASAPRHQVAAPVATRAGSDWQDRVRAPRPALGVPWAEAAALRRYLRGEYERAVGVPAAWGVRHQDAMRPPPGVRAVIVPPAPDPCYLPDPHLLFVKPALGSPALLFVCERHGGGVTPPPGATVVVPVRSVYIVNNSVFLRRVAGAVVVPTISFGMEIDADSWTWSFNATVPFDFASVLQPSGPEPVDIEAVINGVPYRLIVERLATTRTFAQRAVSVSGRGRNAVLADPYAAVRSFTEPGARTAQQLMEDALADNGIPIGWAVEFGLDDWLVPGGTWAHHGTWLTAVQTIAEAAGGYVQPHRTDPTLRILPRYPAGPWDWAGLTPDFELPAAVTTVEAIEWVDKPIYNRVFVSGERNGVLGRVTRAGTAGDAIAPTVVHPLVTHADAARQRGLAVLSDVGRQAPVAVTLPVLSETGVIAPGSLVRYLDGSTTRLGMVRTTSVGGDLQLRQTLGLETHVAP